MALFDRKAAAVRLAEEGGPTVIAQERICLTREGAVVPGGHVLGESLLVGEGCELAAEDAARYGLTEEGRLPPDWEKRLGQKMLRPEQIEDKAVRPEQVANKSSGRKGNG